ncbi:hypothetical protein FVE85_1642 [Porphyridium purpureum]|uniref:Uncharacterized protein n=1 Tax=Porphyridium purpureum TaxID=35688 RepID=A0A5J4YYE1_PORPP|nr:hypothetical protein FVE85_1642 [Porphyridium purpureum]|eukprot:POR1513..scf209_3
MWPQLSTIECHEVCFEMVSVIVDAVGSCGGAAGLKRLSDELANSVGSVLNIDAQHVLVILLGGFQPEHRNSQSEVSQLATDVKISASCIQMLRTERHLLFKLVSEVIAAFAGIPADAVSVRLVASGAH